MKKSFLIISILLLSLFSCEKDDNSPHVYSGKVLVDNLPPVMGGCIDKQDGSLLTFNLPLLKETNPCNPEILYPAKVQKINSSGKKEIILELNNRCACANSLYKDTFANVYAWVPKDFKIDLASTENGDVFISYDYNNTICKIIENGEQQVQSIERVTSITNNRNNGIYAISSPIYTGEDLNTIIPPVIYEIDDKNNKREYFKFPNNLVYETGSSSGYSNKMYPTDIWIDIATDANGDIYVCIGNNNIIYKIDKDKNFSIYRDDIICPVSIAFDKNNKVYIVSADTYVKNGDTFEEHKPLEIITINSNIPEVIYEEKGKARGGYKYVTTLGTYYTSNSNYNISINSKNKIFLENPLEGKIMIIE